MINCIAFDVEILPNFFSITFINMNDYLIKFKDCVNEKGKPIPLTQKLTVKEIKERLDTIDHKEFYITDTDDNQLFLMIDYINKTKYIIDENENYVTRTDLYGFNSLNYDNLMIAALLSNYIRCDTTKELIHKLYNTSKLIIESQNDDNAYKNNFYLNGLRNYKLPFIGIDVMRIFALNKASTYTDKDTKEKKYVAKGLKQTSINLQWYELLEYELPNIKEEEVKKFYNKNPKYKGLNCDQLNKLVDKWDRYILDEYIPSMMYYNKNDVFIVCEIVRLNPDEIKSRYSISATYKVNVLNSSRSNTADKLFEKFYSKFSGLQPYQWKGKKTERTTMSFNKAIFPFIKFKTKELQDFLEDIKKVSVTRVNKEAFSREIKIGDIIYTMAMGGLHSQDRPMELWSSNRGKWVENESSSTGIKESSNDYVYIHADINSMYPSIIAAHKIAPAHMNQNAFCNCIDWIRVTRVKAKHSIEEYIDGIQRDLLALVLKIVINAIYGKFSFEKGDIYDRLCTVKTTINGQLMILMLIEELELNNIHIISANTDGIVIKLYNRDKEKYNEIKTKWEEYTKLKFDTDYYECLISRDVNNYIALFRETKKGVNILKAEYKGALNPLMYAIDLQKGYNMPIVATAVENYFIHNKPVMDTLREATNILDFCKTQNVGKDYHVELVKVIDGKITQNEYQRYVRFYVSNNGHVIKKVHNSLANTESRLAANSAITILNTLDDKDIALRNIDYKYYYQEAMKIIEPIKLNITPKGKGRSRIKKYSGMYNSIFDDDD